MEEYVIKNQKKLRLGITTGTCSAAAAQAAAMQLLLGVESHAVTLRTPKGMTVSVPVYLLESDSQKASYKVVKDSGDDPDVTNGTDVCVMVEFAKQRVREWTDGSEEPDGSAEPEGSVGIRGSKKSSGSVEIDGRMETGIQCNSHESQDSSCAFTSESFPYLTLDGGPGIGRVTKEGLEQAVGQAAINRVPRQMIFDAVADVCEKANVCEPLHITVWMPEGETLAKRTFNPKLGIEGGLSVLGTSGILEPMSEQAIVATIETEIRQLHAVGEEKVLVTPGNYGQAYASKYLGLDLAKSVKSSNYIGDTIDLAISYGMKDFLLVGNIGKLVKLAAGIFNTHSKVADGRGEIFAVHAAMAGAGADVVQEIYNCINTDRMLDVVEREGLREAVMQSILAAIEKHVSGRIGDAMRFGVIVFSEKYGYLGQTKDTAAVLGVFRGKLQM